VKLIHSNGVVCLVRDCGPVIMTLRRGPAPIKQNGWVVLGDDEARALIRRLMDEGATRETMDEPTENR
jgi:hypothetical protein